MLVLLSQYNYIYDLREIQNNFLLALKSKEKKKGRPSKINFIYRERSLYYACIQDIIKFCKLRKYDLKGHREVFLCSFTKDLEKVLNDVLS